MSAGKTLAGVLRELLADYEAGVKGGDSARDARAFLDGLDDADVPRETLADCPNCDGIGALYVGTIHSSAPNGQANGKCRVCGGTRKVRAAVPRETLAEALMSVLVKHTNLSTDAIDECVPVMLAVIPAAEAPEGDVKIGRGYRGGYMGGPPAPAGETDEYGYPPPGREAFVKAAEQGEAVTRGAKPCACGGWSGVESEFHHTGCADLAAVPNECAATGASCSYGPHGRNGESQCQYCGAADVPRETTPVAAWYRAQFELLWKSVYGTPPAGAMPDSIRTLDLNLDQTVAERVRDGVRALFEPGSKDGS